MTTSPTTASISGNIRLNQFKVKVPFVTFCGVAARCNSDDAMILADSQITTIHQEMLDVRLRYEKQKYISPHIEHDRTPCCLLRNVPGAHGDIITLLGYYILYDCILIMPPARHY